MDDETIVRNLLTTASNPNNDPFHIARAKKTLRLSWSHHPDVKAWFEAIAKAEARQKTAARMKKFATKPITA